MASSADTLKQIEDLVKSDRIVLFMKGSRSFPQCGFSATVVQILDGMVPEYKTVNVLADASIRDGVKVYSKWPTIPQLYIDGEFVGGCDIIREMAASGELAGKLGVQPGASAEPPVVKLSSGAIAALQEALADAEAGDVIQIAISGRFEHELGIGPAQPGSLTVTVGGIPLAFDPASARRASGLSIDFVDEGGSQGFKIDNPNAPARVVELDAKELAAKLESGEIRELYDVRTPDERARAMIKGSKLLDDAAMKQIGALDKDTPLAFYCHRGARSVSAAEHFRDQGFRKVYSLRGGIASWSTDVDPNVPKY